MMRTIGLSLLVVTTLLSACSKQPMRPTSVVVPNIARPAPALVAASMPHAMALESTDQRVCNLAASIDVGIDHGFADYLTKSLVLPNGEHLNVVDQGTAHIQDIEATDDKGASIEFTAAVDSADTAQDADTTQYDVGVRILPYMGRVYILHYAGSQPLYLDEIDRLTSENRIVPVCRFKDNVDIMFMPTEKSDDAFCDRVKKGSINVVKERHPRHNPLLATQLVAGDANAEASVRVDFQNIGRPQLMFRLLDASGAGPGCDTSRFILESKSSNRENELLHKLQDKTSSEGYVSGTLAPGCADEPERWIINKNRSYLEMRSGKYNAPVTEDSQYWLVSTIEHGRTRRVCEAFYLHLPPSLLSMWNGKVWSPAVTDSRPAH